MPDPAIDVIFPCLNEEDALPGLLAALPPGYRGLVVDNGSTDRSADRARSAGALVISEPRRGFGAAAHAGLVAATAPIVAFCDADGSLDPADLPRVVDPVRRGQADLMLGRRRPVRRSVWPAHARIGNAILTRQLRSRCALSLHDLGPMRAAKRMSLYRLMLVDRRSGYPLEMVIKAAAAGWTIAEVDVGYHPRIGRSKVTGTIRGTMTAVLDMSRQLAGVSE